MGFCRIWSYPYQTSLFSVCCSAKAGPPISSGIFLQQFFKGICRDGPFKDKSLNDITTTGLQKLYLLRFFYPFCYNTDVELFCQMYNVLNNDICLFFIGPLLEKKNVQFQHLYGQFFQCV